MGLLSFGYAALNVCGKVYFIIGFTFSMRRNLFQYTVYLEYTAVQYTIMGEISGSWGRALHRHT